ncbi:MAG: tetratricopeptide repeat protein [Pirellulales bacterium]|nr:tetratricopeptide repeat protein [Pirellulales bacterium]
MNDASHSAEPSSPVGNTAGRQIALLAASLVAALPFAASWNFALLNWDDLFNIAQNPHFNPPTFASLLRFWQEPYGYLYIPVTYLVMGVEAAVARQVTTDAVTFNPAVFHGTSLVLHTVCTGLVAVLLWQLVRNRRAAVVSAFAFAWHPLQTETVCWVSEQKGLLAAALGLTALNLYVYCQQRGSRAALSYVAATIAFGLALLCKPAAVAVPLVALALSLGVLARPWRAALLSVVPWLALAALLAYATNRLQTAEGGTPQVVPWARPMIAGDALTFYAWKTLLPARLSPDYGRSPASVLQSGWVYLMWPLPLIALAALTRLPHARGFLTAALVFVAALLPVCGLIPFGFQAISTVGDRYAYLAMLGPALAMALLFNLVPRPGIKIAAGILLAAWALLSWKQTDIWRNDATLFRHVLSINGRSWVAHERLAAVAVRDGDYASAASHYLAALAIKPHSALDEGNLGLALEALARYDESETHFRAALEIEPQNVAALRGLGLAELRRGQPSTAIEYFNRLLEVAPQDAILHYNLGQSLVRSNERVAAVVHLRQACNAAPAFAGARLALARLHATGAEFEPAIEAYRAVVRARPDWLTAAAELAWILSTQKAAEFRNGPEAVRLTDPLVAVEPPSAVALDLRAAALAENQQFDEAAATATRAAELAAASGNAALAAAIRERALGYKNKTPYRATDLALPDLNLPGDPTPARS